MAEMKITPDGFPAGRVVEFNFENTTRNGNDLVKECEVLVVRESWTHLVRFLAGGGHERLRVFTGFVERELEKRAANDQNP